jgi:ubiquinone/menaquinone biosynthesis C-methylase UbiE
MKNILDLGCGSGDLIRHLNKEKKDCNFYGIDFSSENIKTCISKNKFDNIFFKQGVGEKLEFEDDFFEEVYCMEVLEHVDSFEKTINEIKRVLKKGGKLTLTVPLKKSEIILMKLNPNYFEQAGHNRFFSKEDILNALKIHKFKMEKYTAYNSIEHIYWAYAFKKGRNIISQLGEKSCN